MIWSKVPDILWGKMPPLAISDSLNCFTAFIRIARFFDIELLDVLLPLFDPDPVPVPVPVPDPVPDLDPDTDSNCLEPVAWSNARGCDSDCDRY